MESILFPSKSSFAVFVWIAVFFISALAFKGIDTELYSASRDIFTQSLNRLHNLEMDILGIKEDISAIEIIPTANAESVKKSIPADDLECMTENIYHEAGTQSYAGKIAVGQVVMNRVKSNGYPRTVCGVIYDGSQNTQTTSCQFSWTCTGKKSADKSSAAWEQSKKAAYALLSKKETLIDITEGATSYHADYVNPDWAKRLRFVAQIDQHLFYRTR